MRLATAAIGNQAALFPRSATPMHERDPEEVPGNPQGQARSGAHSRATLVGPLDRHDRDPVAAPAGEVDQLDVEYDAGHLLALEQVVSRGPSEALEAALGVL